MRLSDVYPWATIGKGNHVRAYVKQLLVIQVKQGAPESWKQPFMHLYGATRAVFIPYCVARRLMLYNVW